MHNVYMVRALKARKMTGGENMPVHMIGDILASELSHMQAYIRFCSCQLNGATLLQQRTDQEPDFKTFLKVTSHTSLKQLKILVKIDIKLYSNQNYAKLYLTYSKISVQGLSLWHIQVHKKIEYREKVPFFTFQKVKLSYILD